MKARTQFIKRARELGVEVFDDAETIELFAPNGKVFGTTGTHMLCIDWNRPPGRWRKPDAYQSLINDMSMGLEDDTDRT